MWSSVKNAKYSGWLLRTGVGVRDGGRSESSYTDPAIQEVEVMGGGAEAQVGAGDENAKSREVYQGGMVQLLGEWR